MEEPVGMESRPDGTYAVTVNGVTVRSGFTDYIEAGMLMDALLHGEEVDCE